MALKRKCFGLAVATDDFEKKADPKKSRKQSKIREKTECVNQPRSPISWGMDVSCYHRLWLPRKILGKSYKDFFHQ
jgi:hypothetical protein